MDEYDKFISNAIKLNTQRKEVVKNSSQVVKDILRINLKTPYKRTLPQFK